MHDIKWIRDNPDAFDRALKRRGLDPESDNLIKIDELRRARIRVLESWQARRNAGSKEIGEAKKAGNEARVVELMADIAECKTSIATLEKELRESDEQLNRALAQIPNLPLDEVPDGADEKGNVEHHRFGAKREYKDKEGRDFTPKQHFDLGEALGQMDFETAAKLSGARFVVLKSGLARLERALSQFMLDVHTGEHGYTEVNPPLLVRDEAMFGTAQLPKFAEDQFAAARRKQYEEFLEDMQKANITFFFEARKKFLQIQPNGSEEDFTRWMLSDPSEAGLELKSTDEIEKYDMMEKLWLIPTAEVSLTNLVREAITDEAQLPLRFTACTPCFRAEAGAAGKDTRGMIRQHQFTKVELVSITTPEQSRDEHERMLSSAEEILRRLDLHYRVVTLCTGDMGFAAQKTYDIEVWLPGQNMYREISSCSVCGEFQARRMNARCRPKGGSPRYVHTLNGSGVAVGRALIAVMENYQQEDGSIAVPDVLQPYMGGKKTIERAH